MRPLRRFMLLSCIVLITVLWTWAWLRPDVHTGLEAWPVQLWAVLCVVNALVSIRPAGRQGLLTAALLLLGSTQAVQAWHILMPYEDWLAAGLPDKPTLATLPAILLKQGQQALSLQWVPGCSRLPWPAWLLGAPLCWCTQLVNGNHPVMPAWSRWVAKLAMCCWGFAMLMTLGIFMIGILKDAPILFWGVLVFLLPLQRKLTVPWLLWPAWLACLAGLIAASSRHVIAPSLITDAALASAMCLTVLNWLAWYVRMDAVSRFDSVLAGLRDLLPEPLPTSSTSAKKDSNTPIPATPEPAKGFDLHAHLDSPQAQEGADKYTRE